MKSFRVYQGGNNSEKGGRDSRGFPVVTAAEKASRKTSSWADFGRTTSTSHLSKLGLQSIRAECTAAEDEARPASPPRMGGRAACVGCWQFQAMTLEYSRGLGGGGSRSISKGNTVDAFAAMFGMEFFFPSLFLLFFSSRSRESASSS